MLEGGCECGAVRYRLTGDPIIVNCCHCRDCQRTSGSAFALNAMIESDRVEASGAFERVTIPEKDGAAFDRCAACGTILWGYHRYFGEGARFVRAGTLDTAEALAPDAHFFTIRKHPWITIPEGVAAYERLPENGFGPELTPERRARIEAVTGALAPPPMRG